MSRQSLSSRELLQNYKCAITLSFPFIEAVEITSCGHLFDKKSLDSALQTQPNSCPCCRGPVESKRPLSHRDMANFADLLSQHPEFYQDVSFDLDRFRDIVQKNKLQEPIGERFLTVLENVSNYLNPAIATLASTSAGRDCLRKKLKIVDEKPETQTKKYYFGNAEISAKSLQTEINGRSIHEWLNMSTERELKLEKIRTSRKAAAQLRLFAAHDAQTHAAGHRLYSEEVNPLLQQLVYGEESKVREMLEAVKDNVAQLSVLLEHTGIVQDYSGRTITGMTLLQAAAAAGDVEMCQMLKVYMSSEAFTAQLIELFPEGIEAHEAKQQKEAFNFDSIIAAILRATPAELEAALNKEGAQFTQTDSARSKPDDQLTLVEALNRFREQFSNLSKNETIFNPYHLLRAYEVYNQFFDQRQRDGVEHYIKKGDLSWRQMVGLAQRFVPACYAQAFAQGLSNLVKVEGYQNDDWLPKVLERNLKLKYTPCSCFPVDPHSSACSGLGFDFAIFVVGKGPRSPLWCVSEEWRVRCDFFKNLCRAKTVDLQNIMLCQPSHRRSHD